MISDEDYLWLIHLLLGIIVSAGCVLGLLAVFRTDCCIPVVAKELESERDRRWEGTGRARFLF